jgi:hypothetical protein
MNEKLIQFQCNKEGTLFYYQSSIKADFIRRCPLCGSTRVEQTGRTFPPVNETVQTISTEPFIRAEVHADDHAAHANFDARPWFEQATDNEIRALVEIEFGGNIESDSLAQFCEDYDENVKAVGQYVQTVAVGYECNISPDDACKWIAQNRPLLWQKLTSDDEDRAIELEDYRSSTGDNKPLYKSN